MQYLKQTSGELSRVEVDVDISTVVVYNAMILVGRDDGDRDRDGNEGECRAVVVMQHKAICFNAVLCDAMQGEAKQRKGKAR